MSESHSQVTSDRPQSLPQLDTRQAVQEIAQISRGDIPLEVFCSEFLNRVVAAMGAVGGVFWTIDDKSLNLTYQINIQQLNLKVGDAAEQQHQRLLGRLLNGGNGVMLVPPHSSFGSTNSNNPEGSLIGNPTDYPLVFFPMRTELENAGLTELILPPDRAVIPPQLAAFYAQACAIAVDYFKNRQLRHFADRQNLWMQLEDFTRTIHAGLDVTETAYTITNEGRKLIQCDRVSIAQRFGNKCKVIAISGQDVIDKRSKTVRLLGKLAAAVVKSNERICYLGDTTNFAPQVEKAVELYVDESHTKMIVVYPLSRETQAEDEQIEKRQKKIRPEKPFGALIVEQIESTRENETMWQRIKVVAEHSNTALGNALDHHNIFLMPVWKTIGKTKIIFAARHLPKTIAVGAGVLILLLLFIFLPWKFQVYAQGTLEPVKRQRIYAPLEAEIKKLCVDHHSVVSGPQTAADGTRYRGTILVELRSSELDSQETQLRGEQLETIEKIASLTRQTLDQDRKLTGYDKADLAGQLEQAKIQLDTIQRKIQIFESQQKQDLFITSPMDGVVVSWDIKQRLTEKRPISRMQYVMEVADLSSDWQLELSVPEKLMGYIGDSKALEFVLATDPSKKYKGTIVDVHDRAEVRTDLGSAGNNVSGLNTVLIKVQFDKQSLPAELLRPGAECNARVNCGKRALGYVLFYEVIAWVQKNVLFRWF